MFQNIKLKMYVNMLLLKKVKIYNNYLIIYVFNKASIKLVMLLYSLIIVYLCFLNFINITLIFRYYKCSQTNQTFCLGTAKFTNNAFTITKKHNHEPVQRNDINIINFRNVLKRRATQDIGILNSIYEDEARRFILIYIYNYNVKII